MFATQAHRHINTIFNTLLQPSLLGRIVAIIVLNLLSPGLWLAKILLAPYIQLDQLQTHGFTAQTLSLLLLKLKMLGPNVIFFQMAPLLLCCLLFSFAFFQSLSRLSQALIQHCQKGATNAA